MLQDIVLVNHYYIHVLEKYIKRGEEIKIVKKKKLAAKKKRAKVSKKKAKESKNSKSIIVYFENLRF